MVKVIKIAKVTHTTDNSIPSLRNFQKTSEIFKGFPEISQNIKYFYKMAKFFTQFFFHQMA